MHSAPLDPDERGSPRSFSGRAGSLVLKVDVDTWRGVREGVPRLLRMLESRRLGASFFFTHGPDRSGRALLNCLKSPAFLAKMVRTRAWRLYGLRALVSGTLLPAPVPSIELADLMRATRDAGHEVGVHGWDHRQWQDRLDHRPESWIRDQIQRARERHHELFEAPPRGFAAPGWMIDERCVDVLLEQGFEYSSSTRLGAPALVRSHSGETLLEIPSTTPCPEERMGREDELFPSPEVGDARMVFPAHAEVEGGVLLEAFTRWLDEQLERGVRVITLGELAAELLADSGSLPERSLGRVDLEGRAAPVSTLV